MEEWRYNSKHKNRYFVEVSGQLHALAVLAPESPVTHWKNLQVSYCKCTVNIWRILYNVGHM